MNGQEAARALADPRIRPASDGDGGGLAALIAAVFAEYDGCLYDPAEFPELGAPASHFAARGGLLLVAEQAGTIVGCFAIAPSHTAGTFEITKVYVAAPLRGCGLSRRLYDRALAFAEAKGATRLVLWTDTRFTRAHAFYARLGFVQEPGLRALHDISNSLEFVFARTLTGDAAP